jgi:homoprotocatechuate degradation regulator HpaR
MQKTRKSPPPRRAKRVRSDRTQSPQIPIRDLSRSLPMALMRAREAVMQYFRPHHRVHGVTEQQWRVLRVLNKVGALEIADLARQTVLMAPSLSRILRDLEAASIVRRRPVEGDLRRSLISLSPAGVELLAKVAPLSEASFAEINRCFGGQRLDQLFKLLSELERELNSNRRRKEIARDPANRPKRQRRTEPRQSRHDEDLPHRPAVSQHPTAGEGADE